MRALVFRRKPVRYAAAVVAGSIAPGRGARFGPLTLDDVEPPALPGPGWQRVRPLLTGICGSDLATVDGRSSRYFEPIVSFPFVPGHEVVGLTEAGDRVVLEPVLRCAARGIEPQCEMCRAGRTNLCERTAFGGIEPGLQTGYCRDTSGGWSAQLVAHDSQLHEVPDDLSDEAAVMVEPTACAVHASSRVDTDDVAVIGAGTLGLCTVAALSAAGGNRRIIIAAKYPHQRELARSLGATIVVDPSDLRRAVRRDVLSLEAGRQLTSGVPTVIDCVGSDDSLSEALSIVAPGGAILLVGMPGPQTSVDLTPLWHREVSITAAYAYLPADFGDAFDLVESARLDRLVTATYPLDRYTDAIDHAANAGRRGAVKIAFDLRGERA